MKAPNLLALSAAVLLSAGTLVAVHHNVALHPASVINGIEVVDLAPVIVSPTAKERRDALLMNNVAATHKTATSVPVAAVDLATVFVTPSADELTSAFLFADAPTPTVFSDDANVFDGTDLIRPQLIKPQLAMPYYSFGNTARFIGKE